jgi:hypothetical protein
MDKDDIIKQLDEYINTNLKGIPFDKALPQLQNIMWSIADKNRTTGAEIFKIYMDYKSKQK